MSGREILVRGARESDIDAVLAIERVSFADPWDRDSFELALDPTRMLFLVAEEPATAVREQDDSARPALLGYGIALLLLDEGEVADLAVAPDARGRGVGARLLDALTLAAHSTGVRSMYLEVRESNVRARTLYASRSFAPVGRRRGYYRNPTEDALLLRRDLAQVM